MLNVRPAYSKLNDRPIAPAPNCKTPHVALRFDSLPSHFYEINAWVTEWFQVRMQALGVSAPLYVSGRCGAVAPGSLVIWLSGQLLTFNCQASDPWPNGEVRPAVFNQMQGRHRVGECVSPHPIHS